MTFTWQGRRLATANVNGKSLSFKYNSDGIRTQKTVNGTTTYFTLDGSKIISQKKGNQEIFFEYDAQGNVATMIYNGQTYYYVRNLTGEILGLTDSSGNMIVEYLYDPWGKLIDYSNTGNFDLANLNPFKYKDYYYDSELGFYYLNSRYYDPVTSRFINADGQIASVGGELLGYNMFAYCFNNPINMDDPTGNWPSWLKELGSRVWHGITTFAKIVASPFKAMTAKVGAGVGLGAKAKANIDGVPVEGGVVTSITDSVVYEKGKLDARNKSSTTVGVNVAEVFDFSYEHGHEHSYYDDECTCDFWKSTFEEKSECVANRDISSTSGTIGFSAGLYLLFGVEASINIDLKAWNDELILIFNESLEYGK